MITVTPLKKEDMVKIGPENTKLQVLENNSWYYTLTKIIPVFRAQNFELFLTFTK